MKEILDIPTESTPFTNLIKGLQKYILKMAILGCISYALILFLAPDEVFIFASMKLAYPYLFFIVVVTIIEEESWLPMHLKHSALLYQHFKEEKSRVTHLTTIAKKVLFIALIVPTLGFVLYGVISFVLFALFVISQEELPLIVFKVIGMGVNSAFLFITFDLYAQSKVKEIKSDLDYYNLMKRYE